MTSGEDFSTTARAAELEVAISEAAVADAAVILALQRLAFESEARLHDDWTIPPLTQTLDGLVADFADRVFLKAEANGRIVGAVRAMQVEDTCFVERLIVHPDAQGRGIGGKLLGHIEARFPTARRYELFTGHRSAGNLAFDARRGDRPFREQPVNERLRLVFMEKRREG